MEPAVESEEMKTAAAEGGGRGGRKVEGGRGSGGERDG